MSSIPMSPLDSSAFGVARSICSIYIQKVSFTEPALSLDELEVLRK